MKNIAIGKYIPGNSFIHKLDPRIKFFLMTAMIYLSVSPVNFNSLGVAAFIVLIIFFVAGFRLGKIRAIIKPFKFMFIFLLIINIITFKQGEVISDIFGVTDIFGFQISSLNIYDKAIYRTILIVTRVILMIMISSVLTATTKPIDLTIALEDILKPYIFGGIVFAGWYTTTVVDLGIDHSQWIIIGGSVPIAFIIAKLFPVHSIAMIISIALRFIPTLLDETDKIMKAQASRGADYKNGKFKEKMSAMITLIVPLFASSFQKAMDLADAMESRGYIVGAPRTRYRYHRPGFRDFLAFIFVAVGIAAVVYVVGTEVSLI